MALNQAELNQLVIDLNTELALDASFAQKVANILAGGRREPITQQQLLVVAPIRREMRSDTNFVTALRATPGFPALPPGTVAPAAQPVPAPVVAAPAPAVVVAPVVAPGPVVQPVVAPAPAVAAPALNTTCLDLIRRINAGLPTDRNAQRTYNALVNVINGGDDRVHRNALDVKLAIQAEQQRAQTAGETFPAAQMVAAINVPAPVAAPQVQQPVIPAQPVVQVQPQVVVAPPVNQQPAQAPAQAVAPGQQQVQPAAQVVVQPIVQQQPQVAPAAAQGQQPVAAPVAPVAPVVAAAGNTGWPKWLMYVVAILAIIGGLWLCGQFVSAFFTKLVTAEARSQISQRDREIEVLRERVNVLQGDVSTAIAARDLAQREQHRVEMSLGELRGDYNLSELPALRNQLAEAKAELDRLRPEAASLREQLATTGRTAREAAAAHTTQMRGLEQRIAALVGESEQMNGLIRQLQDPSNIGAPCDVDILTLNVSEGTNTTLRIRRWGEDRDQTFSVPGAGDRQIGRCSRVYNTSGGVHLITVDGIQRQKMIVPAGMTIYVRYGTTGTWHPHRFSRATILLGGGDASLEYRNPDLAELAARR